MKAWRGVALGLAVAGLLGAGTAYAADSVDNADYNLRSPYEGDNSERTDSSLGGEIRYTDNPVIVVGRNGGVTWDATHHSWIYQSAAIEGGTDSISVWTAGGYMWIRAIGSGYLQLANSTSSAQNPVSMLIVKDGAFFSLQSTRGRVDSVQTPYSIYHEGEVKAYDEAYDLEYDYSTDMEYRVAPILLLEDYTNIDIYNGGRMVVDGAINFTGGAHSINVRGKGSLLMFNVEHANSYYGVFGSAAEEQAYLDGLATGDIPYDYQGTSNVSIDDTSALIPYMTQRLGLRRSHSWISDDGNTSTMQLNVNDGAILWVRGSEYLYNGAFSGGGYYTSDNEYDSYYHATFPDIEVHGIMVGGSGNTTSDTSYLLLGSRTQLGHIAVYNKAENGLGDLIIGENAKLQGRGYLTANVTIQKGGVINAGTFYNISQGTYDASGGTVGDIYNGLTTTGTSTGNYTDSITEDTLTNFDAGGRIDVYGTLTFENQSTLLITKSGQEASLIRVWEADNVNRINGASLGTQVSSGEGGNVVIYPGAYIAVDPVDNDSLNLKNAPVLRAENGITLGTTNEQGVFVVQQNDFFYTYVSYDVTNGTVTGVNVSTSPVDSGSLGMSAADQTFHENLMNAFASPGLGGQAQGMVAAYLRTGYLSSEAQGDALMQMNPNIHGHAIMATQAQAEQFRGIIMDEVSSLRLNAGLLGPTAYDGVDEAFGNLDATETYLDPYGFRFWARPFYEKVKFDGYGSMPGTDLTDYGAAVGIDRQEDTFRWGLAASVSTGKLDGKDVSYKNDLDNVTVGGYASFAFGHYFVDGMASYGYTWNNTHRNISIPGSFTSEPFSMGANADYGSHALQGGVTAGAVYFYGDTRFVPTIGAYYAKYIRAQFEEDETSMLYKRQDYDSFTVPLQVTVSQDFVLSNGWLISPEFRFGWQHEFCDTDADQDMRFIGTSVAYTSSGYSPGRNRWNAGVGLGFRMDDRMDGFIRYDYQWKSKYERHLVVGGFGLRY